MKKFLLVKIVLVGLFVLTSQCFAEDQDGAGVSVVGSNQNAVLLDSDYKNYECSFASRDNFLTTYAFDGLLKETISFYRGERIVLSTFRVKQGSYLNEEVKGYWKVFSRMCLSRISKESFGGDESKLNRFKELWKTREEELIKSVQ
ncbi:hypothetical protein ACFL08_04165 [Patescibacteria group bacterium]